MSQINGENFYTKLTEWMALSKELARVKEEEITLRKDLFDYSFPAPKEGTQRVDLQEAWKLKGEYKLNRKIDEAPLDAILERLREEFKVDTSKLIKTKQELSVTEYKKLPKEAADIMDQALVVSPGTPSLTVEPPKGKK